MAAEEILVERKKPCLNGYIERFSAYVCEIIKRIQD